MAEIKDKTEETFRIATNLRYQVKAFKLLNFKCFVIRKASRPSTLHMKHFLKRNQISEVTIAQRGLKALISHQNTFRMISNVSERLILFSQLANDTPASKSFCNLAKGHKFHPMMRKTLLITCWSYTYIYIYVYIYIYTYDTTRCGFEMT